MCLAIEAKRARVRGRKRKGRPRMRTEIDVLLWRRYMEYLVEDRKNGLLFYSVSEVHEFECVFVICERSVYILNVGKRYL